MERTVNVQCISINYSTEFENSTISSTVRINKLYTYCNASWIGDGRHWF